jgi:peptidoglycan DL-endopeptidase CwlO
VHTPPDDRRSRTSLPLLGARPGSRKLSYRATTLTAALATLGILAATGGVAVASSAAPKPTISQVQHKLTQLNAKSDTLDEQFDQAKQQLNSANQRLKVVNQQVARYARQFTTMRTEVGRIAAQEYEQGNLNSSVVMLTSGNPQQILDQSSILLELSSTNNAEINQFIAAAHQLSSTQQAARRTQAGIAQLKTNLGQRRSTLNKLIAQEKTLLAQLTPAQQTGIGPGAPPTTSGGGGGGGTYTGPTSTQADKAVAYVYAQLGCPYVYGGVGPCSSGFDCSGLMMQAWASAGIGIPRTSEEQWGLPHVSTSAMQPGDILEFAGESHVGMYVGGGMMIDAPHTGLNVEKVALSGWYSQELDGVVRP